MAALSLTLRPEQPIRNQVHSVHIPGQADINIISYFILLYSLQLPQSVLAAMSMGAAKFK